MTSRRIFGWAVPTVLVLAAGLVLVAGCPGDEPVVSNDARSGKPGPPVSRQPVRINPNVPWKGKPAAFTFSTDDNNDGNLAYAKVARDRGIRFTIFTVSDWVGRPGKLTWADLRTLYDDGFEIGGHSMTHPRLTQLDDAALEKELVGCQVAMEKGIGRPDYECDVFAYPFHDHDGRVIAFAKRFYKGARDGGLSSLGWPGFSQSTPFWGEINLYEVPNSITIASLVWQNQLSEEETRQGLRGHFEAWKNRHFWVNVYAHGVNEVDADHLAWILDEVISDGGFWVAPFGEVAQYYRETTGN